MQGRFLPGLCLWGFFDFFLTQEIINKAALNQSLISLISSANLLNLFTRLSEDNRLAMDSFNSGRK